MVTTIVLPLDGSPIAERALPYAASIARRSGARIVLVGAVHGHTFPAIDPSDAQTQVIDQAQSTLDAAVSRLEASGVTAESHVYSDDPVHAILDAAQRQAADLIVMSTHGRSGLGRMVYSSVTDHVLRRATVPVLLVPSIVERPWPTDAPLSLLVPLDGSELAEEALSAAEVLAEAFDTRLTLLYVVESPTYPLYGEGYAYVPYEEDVELAGARQYLEEHVDRLLERGRQAEAKVMVGKAASAIPVAAREGGANAIVMATHGRGGLARLMLGSVATSTLRQSTVPLLLVRPTMLHQEASPATAPTPATVPEPLAKPESTIEVRLSPSDLELIGHALRALPYAPGYDYGHVLAAQALARRLKATADATPGEPVAVG